MLVRDLRDLGADDLATAGGKGANLGRLIRAGFPVPDGFVIGTAAYAMAAAAAGVDPHDPENARARLAGAAIPREVVDAVRAAYRTLGAPRAAVRSSATAEDLPDASFAGQQDTILDVSGDDAILEAVRRCWASLWNERAVAYRRTHRIDDRTVALAVVVQRLVDAAAAGVLFTADPVTGRRRRAVIEAVTGLGERLVSGAVTPDRYVVDPAAGLVLERRGEVLRDPDLLRLAKMGAKIEDAFGAPQDVEWARDQEGRIWIVQSRNITTLYPVPAAASDPDRDVRVYFSFNVAQGVLGPLTPMGLQTFRLLGSSVATRLGRPVADARRGPAFLAEAGMRLFFDLTPVLRNAAFRELPGVLTGVAEQRSQAILTRVLADARLAPRGSRPLSRIRVLSAALHLGAPQSAIRVLLRPDATRVRLLGEVDAALRAVLVPDEPREALAAYERLLLTLPAMLFPRLIGMVVAGMGSVALAGRVLGRRASGEDLQTLLRGLPHNPTTEMDLELWAIARRARGDEASRHALTTMSPLDLATAYRRGTLPSLLQSDLARFLGTYGHRAIAEIDVGVPRWSEDPTHLLGAVANYLRLEDDALAPDAQFARGAAEAERMVATLAARVHGPRRMIARFVLRRVRALAGLREQPKFQMMRVFTLARAMLARVGSELTTRGVVDSPDDVFFLDLNEAWAALGGADMRHLAATRREIFMREATRRRVPRILLSDGTDAEAAYASPLEAGDIRGTPASPGIARGSARVVLSPVAARLEPGDILVAPSTDPGWTPLFLTAGALVMEMGGMMSHGAVVAREYGIPAVVGVPDATTRIATGERVVVDGSAGTIEREAATP